MISYEFEIISADEQSRCMEVVYSAAGRDPIHVGMRLPYAGEQVADVVKTYAPVRLWEEQEFQVSVPMVGYSGSIDGASVVLTQAQIITSLTSEIQKRLDDFARTRNYDGILSACTYVTSTVAKFKAEGQTCVNLRDATWSAAYNILAQVQAGTRPMPNSIADIEADLPALVWPA